MLSVYFTLQSVMASTKKRLSREESGATAVEYGLLVGLISVGIIAVLIVLGPQVTEMFQKVSDGLTGAETAPAV